MTRATVLVGHGGVPKDCPHELVRKLKQLEAQRRASGRGNESPRRSGGGHDDSTSR